FWTTPGGGATYHRNAAGRGPSLKAERSPGRSENPSRRRWAGRREPQAAPIGGLNPRRRTRSMPNPSYLLPRARSFLVASVAAGSLLLSSALHAQEDLGEQVAAAVEQMRSGVVSEV